MAKNRAYPPEFRAKIIELARSGKSVNSIAKEYDIARLTITNWLKQDDLDAGRRSDGLTTAESAEVAKLRKRVRELEIERDILKKAERGSLARPIRCPQSLRIRESASCCLASRNAVPCAERLGQRVLRVAQATAVRARASGRRAWRCAGSVFRAFALHLRSTAPHRRRA